VSSHHTRAGTAVRALGRAADKMRAIA